MNHKQIYSELTDIFRDAFDDDAIVLTPQTTAEDVPGWDSFNHINLIVAAPAFSVILTYLCVLVGQVFFRADSLRGALRFLADMAGAHGMRWQHAGIQPGPALTVLAGLLIVWCLPNTQEILGQTAERPGEHIWERFAWSPTWAWGVALGLLFFAAILNIGSSGAFLYFQF